MGIPTYGKEKNTVNLHQFKNFPNLPTEALAKDFLTIPRETLNDTLLTLPERIVGMGQKSFWLYCLSNATRYPEGRLKLAGKKSSTVALSSLKDTGHLDMKEKQDIYVTL